MSPQNAGAVAWGLGIEAHSIPPDIIDKLKQQAAMPDSRCTIAYLKLFTPDAGATWWISEWHEIEGIVSLFGLCDLGMGFPELGYVSLKELMIIRGRVGLPIERDLWWKPTSLDKVIAKYGR